MTLMNHSPDLAQRLKEAARRFMAMTPEEQDAHCETQRRNAVRAEKARMAQGDLEDQTVQVVR